MSGNVRFYILTINCQHPNDAFADLAIVNDPHAAPLTFTRDCPADFTEPARSRDDDASRGIGDQGALQGCIIIVREILPN